MRFIAKSHRLPPNHADERRPQVEDRPSSDHPDSTGARRDVGGPIGEQSFICGERRLPFTKESFGTAFKEACIAAGVNKSAHGVRKIGATRAAENGATVAELEAIFGWSGGGMAALYTREADRARLAKGAIYKLARRPSPMEKVRASSRKEEV